MSSGSRLVLAESVLSIRSVITYPLSVPQPAASGRTGFVNSLVVEIVTADGRSGFGKSCSPVSPRATARLVEDALAPVLLGAAPHDDLTCAPTAHPSLLDGDGCLPAPQGPGLGIEVNRETFARLAIH
jgi:L-alanine-DL-glutamate epimerase-like enolase superfamily enzyme